MKQDRTTTSGGVSRRRFLQGAGGAAAATTVLATLGAKSQAAEVEPSKGRVRSGLRKYSAAGEKITLDVNGRSADVALTPDTTLLEAMRESLDLTGAKQVCDRGACGACTVLVDGKSVNSCLMLAVDAVGHKITTVEGLAHDGQLDPVQQAFVEHDACQCGYCIPGFVVRSRALLDEKPNASREQIRDGLCGNICRCAAYVRILEAVEAAAGKGGRA